MIKSNYQRLLLYLLFLIHLIPSYSQSAGYREFLISIPDSLTNIVQQYSVSARQSSVKQFLKLSEDVSVKQIADVPFSKMSSWYLIRLSDSKLQQVEILGQSTSLEHLQENHTFKIHMDLPNDELYTDQWYHSQIQAVESWEGYVPNDEIILAIIDTGIDYEHPDLQGSLWINLPEDLNGNRILDSADINNLDDDGNGYVDDVIGWDFTDAPRFADGGDYLDPDNDPMDEYLGGHGTKIAGIVAAQTANSIGVAALTPGASVMNIRAGTAGGYLEEDDVARAVLYAINNGARVVNMSFGDVVVSRFLKDVIEYAYSEGTTIIASAGNSGTDVTHYPSGLPQTISVGASDRSDQIAGFSNWGHTIDLVAPGVEIIAPRAGGGYEMANGTSFSAPMVTATAGLLLSKNPEYSAEEIRNLLKTSTEDIGIRGWDERSGSGRLNMYRASQIDKKSSLFVNYPASGISVASDSIPIVITAVDPDLISVDVSYGLGKDPVEWFNLVTGHKYQIIEDTIAVFSISVIPDTSVILKLNIKTWRGETLDYRSIISIDRTEPLISDVTHLRTLDEDQFISLIEFKTDDITSADIFYRTEGVIEPFDVIHLEYETDHHYYLSELQGDIEYYIRVTNMSGLSTIEDNAGQYYKIRNMKENLIPEDFVQVNQSLPAGFILDEATDFDGDGNFEAVLSVYDEFGSFGPVTIYEYVQDQFIKQSETSFKGIPRSYGDADNDGKKELLIGFGQQSFLLEASQQDTWPTEVVWSDTGTFWASRITDLDDDGLNEIVGKEDHSFILLESLADNQFSKKYIFNNPSPGENQLGPPRSEVADIDDDGRLEIYFGDYDGDLIIHENSGNDMFEPGKYVSLPHKDATNYFVSGKILSSGGSRLIAGSHTGTPLLSEHQVNGQYWDFSILSSGQDNQYHFDQHLYIHGYANVRDFESGVNSGIINIGQSDYLFLAPYPDFYIYKSEGDSLIPIWYKYGVNSNAILVHDFDQNGINEFYINDGRQIIGFEQDFISGPGAPPGFQAFPVDTNLVRIKWNQYSGADRYIIYRGNSPENLSKFDSTITETTYLDSSVLNNHRYYYALQTVDFSFEITRSKLGAILSAIPNQPPYVDTLIIKNQNQIEVHFSEPMDINTIKALNFYIRSEDNPTGSAVAFLNGKSVMLSFSNQFLKGVEYQLGMTALRDTNKTPLPEYDSVQLFKYILDDTEKPYVREWKFESNQSLILKFNVPMNSNTILDVANYELEPSGYVQNIESVNDSEQIYRFTFSSDTYGKSSGVTTYLTLSNLFSQQGVNLQDGNRIALVSSSENIADMLVYPQPAVAEDGWLMFSNIVEGTSIKIFDINGHFIAELDELDQNGGVRWNLRDQSGSIVSSGIYIYYATFENQTKLGKFTIIK
jgi:subtilisin family serine protease